MIYTNALLLFLLEHDQIRVCNLNLRSIQELMCLDNMAFIQVQTGMRWFP